MRMNLRTLFSLRGQSLLVAAIIAFVATLPAAATEAKKPLELFGVPLKGATRDQLRHAFQQNGLQALREDDSYWVDTYDSQGVLEGTSRLMAGYAKTTGKFAFAQYTFTSQMDTAQVGKVIDMVSVKYGRPTSLKGRYDLGEVTARWKMGHGMEIEVSRGWPDTTTYLGYYDFSTHKQMKTEMGINERAKGRKKAKSQDHVF